MMNLPRKTIRRFNETAAKLYMEKLYFFVNTINHNCASFAIFTSKGVILYLKRFIDKQELLAAGLADFLKKLKLNFRNIGGVLVINGPGSFSASRAGAVLANSFNFLYNIPVLAIKDTDAKLEDIIKSNLKRLKRVKNSAVAGVYYQAPPNITYADVSRKKI